MNNNNNLSNNLGNDYNEISMIQCGKFDFFQNLCVLPFIQLTNKGHNKLFPFDFTGSIILLATST